MERISGNFVRSLREEIEDRKKIKSYERNLLQDSLNYILDIFKEFREIDLRSVKNFETHELSCIANLYTEEEDIHKTIINNISKKNSEIIFKEIDPKFLILLLDLKGKITGYRNKKNQIVVQFQVKGKHTFEMKVILKNSDPIFSIYEKNYHSFKMWICHNGSIISENVNLRGVNRDLEEIEKDLSSDFKIKVGFYKTGEINRVNIFVKKGRKKENSDYKN